MSSINIVLLLVDVVVLPLLMGLAFSLFRARDNKLGILTWVVSLIVGLLVIVAYPSTFVAISASYSPMYVLGIYVFFLIGQALRLGKKK